MKRILAAVAVVLACSASCYAMKITLFSGTDRFVTRAKDIVIARCPPLPKERPRHIRDGVVEEPYENGLRPVDVQVLTVIKGERKPGALKIATPYAVKPGGTYMLTSTGGLAFGTDFLTTGQLSVVPLPGGFDLERLGGKTTKEQVQWAFSRRLFELERELAPMLEEQSLLERGLQDRADDLYEIDRGVELGEITRARTTEEGRWMRYLELGGTKLMWSHTAPGKSGGFYFCEIGSHKPLWEFAPSPHPWIEGFQGKPLRVRFYGRYTPGRKSAFRWTGPFAVDVHVGEAILARTVDDPSTVYVIRAESQEAAREMLHVKYAVIRQRAAADPADGSAAAGGSEGREE